MPSEVCVGDVTIHPVVSASIGIAIFPRDGDTPRALIKSADSAMYRAKRGGLRFSLAGD